MPLAGTNVPGLVAGLLAPGGCDLAVTEPGPVPDVDGDVAQPAATANSSSDAMHSVVRA